MATPFLVNRLWELWSAPEAGRFARGLHDVERVQDEYLRKLLRDNAGTRYGLRHDFSGIRNYGEFQSRIPAVDYRDIEEEVWSAADDDRILTEEKILLLEPTSGTLGGSKYIPYTKRLRREFQRGIATWVHNLFHYYPELRAGTSFWSISPPPLSRPPPRESRVPVGFDRDSQYLGLMGRWMERSLFSVPASVTRETDPDGFFNLTAFHLLRDASLSLVSVWNPSYWLILLDRAFSRRQELIREIHDGGGRERARQLEAALGDKPQWTKVWPRLRIISCWTDGWAALPARRLAGLFPGVLLQPKGLIATEGMVSIPRLDSREACENLLAYRCHFFEFEDADTRVIHPAWDLAKGATYSVLLTTGGGLYRYRLHDLVKVEGFRGACPSLRFLGREDSRIDLTGEKLEADFVQACAEKALRALGLDSSFFLLVPFPEVAPPHYEFLACLPDMFQAEERLSEAMDQALSANFHYQLSRRLNQLGPVRVIPLEPGAEADYYYYKSRSARLGEIKWKVLETPGPWKQVLRLKLRPTPA